MGLLEFLSFTALEPFLYLRVSHFGMSDSLFMAPAGLQPQASLSVEFSREYWSGCSLVSG